jgi:transposase
MPAVPACLVEPLWVEFSAQLPPRPRYVPGHPLGCHRARVPDRIVFEHVLAALVHGSGYERIASPGCSDATIRRRVQQWAQLGLAQLVHTLALRAYDRMIGLELEDLAVDACVTKAPGGGEAAGRSPVDRGKQGLKRSMIVDGEGIPLGVVATGANRHDSPLLTPTLDAAAEASIELPEQASVHLDRAYDSNVTRRLLEDRGLAGVISKKGKPAPLGATKRWVIERTNSWTNAHKELVWCTEREGPVIDFWVAFSDAVIIVGRLVREAWSRYRWEGRPSRRP